MNTVSDGPLSTLSAYAPPAMREDGVSLLAVANIVLRRARLLAILGTGGAGLAVVLNLIFGTFTSESAFRPASSSAMSGLAGIAAQLGADIGGLAAAETEPLEFWSQLMNSRDLLVPLAQTKFTFATNQTKTDTASGTLIDLYDLTESTPEKTLIAATERLQSDISVKTDLTSGVVTVKVTAPWRDLADKENRELLRRVDEFNANTRRSQAAAEAKFTEQRLREARAELLRSEDSLRTFLESNRTYQTSASLVFEEGRLQRRVDLRQQVYTGLAQAYEQTRIEEVRDTPVITVLESPEGAAKRSLSMVAAVILGAFLGGLAGLFWIFSSEYLGVQRQRNPDGVQEFLSTVASLRPKLRKS